METFIFLRFGRALYQLEAAIIHAPITEGKFADLSLAELSSHCFLSARDH